MVRTKPINLNPYKSPGHDNWHPYFLRELTDVISVPLSILFNKSLKEGAHRSWRKAIIAAIYKKGDRSNPGNYRPVSLTSVIAKIMESIIREKILLHLIRNKVLSDCQHGFVPGRNCLTQLLLCLEDWSKMIKEGEPFDVIYTDFSKAFDSVAHQRLLCKLEHLGIRGDVLNWVRSFLSGRTQRVKVDDFFSKWVNVTSGIPQGSVLGPLLFVVFINDLPDELKYSICKMFADDCKIYRRLNQENVNKLQVDLTNLERWSKKWQLPFNPSECKVMYFGKKNPKNYFVLYDRVLDTVTQEKDLGFIVDDQLKFHEHTAVAAK